MGVSEAKRDCVCVYMYMCVHTYRHIIHRKYIATFPAGKGVSQAYTVLSSVLEKQTNYALL